MTCHFFEPNRADTEPVVRCACDLGPERWVCEETSLDEVLASRGAKPNALIQLREGITRYIVFPMEYVRVQQGEIPARILHSKKGRLTERLTRFRYRVAHAPVRQSIVEPTRTDRRRPTGSAEMDRHRVSGPKFVSKQFEGACERRELHVVTAQHHLPSAAYHPGDYWCYTHRCVGWACPFANMASKQGARKVMGRLHLPARKWIEVLARFRVACMKSTISL